ncbi:type II toxin-antitoxin system VapC family toxin [Rathayibacter sp. YIM 133350]|uniref:type II toxin-antitoxin system VapC family toxin n=1 Tax=Rathayibacter sp. YIM 133350 TaxID=3131992 RepID=UPI00307F448B
MAWYVDTSALVKLLVTETESAALRRWLVASPRILITSDLTRTELMRAVRRGAPGLATQARVVLESVSLVSPARDTFDAAGRLAPATLRTRDAIHLASALELGDDLEGVLTYDSRMANAAEAYGIPVVGPT